MKEKICGICRRKKPLDQFHRRARSRDGRQSDCRACYNARAIQWRLDHPGYHQRRLARTPTYFRESKLRLMYGITLDDYNRMLEAQDGCCAICHRSETVKRGGETAPLAVDHDHTTGTVRGLLCRNCNMALGNLEKVEWRESALRYLRQFDESLLSCDPLRRDRAA